MNPDRQPRDLWWECSGAQSHRGRRAGSQPSPLLRPTPRFWGSGWCQVVDKACGLRAGRRAGRQADEDVGLPSDGLPGNLCGRCGRVSVVAPRAAGHRLPTVPALRRWVPEGRPVCGQGADGCAAWVRHSGWGPRWQPVLMGKLRSCVGVWARRPSVSWVLVLLAGPGGGGGVGRCPLEYSVFFLHWILCCRFMYKYILFENKGFHVFYFGRLGRFYLDMQLLWGGTWQGSLRAGAPVKVRAFLVRFVLGVKQP